MTVGAGIAVQDGSVLREVRPNVVSTPAAGGGLTNGAFLGVRSAPAGSRSVFPVGKLRHGPAVHVHIPVQDVVETQRMGSSGRDIPFETQFMIVKCTDGLQSTGDGTSEQPVVYTVFLPY